MLAQATSVSSQDYVPAPECACPGCALRTTNTCSMVCEGWLAGLIFSVTNLLCPLFLGHAACSPA